MANELPRVLRLIESFKESNANRRDFARRHRLHPSALSRILRIGELPDDLLQELARFERLSRTHLEVLATVPAERRPDVLAAVREGRSTYHLRGRRETTALDVTPPAVAPVAPAPAPVAVDPRAEAIARELGASGDETRAFALELLGVLLRQSPERVRASFGQFRAQRS